MKQFVTWLKENSLALVIPVLLLLVWEGAGRFGFIRATFLPRPSAILEVLIELLASGELLCQLGVSMVRVSEGFIIGALLGIVVGIQMALVKKLQVAVSLIFGLLRPIPVIAWIPLLILWMGIDEGSKITAIAIGSFWTVIVNVVEGIRGVDKKYLGQSSPGITT